MGTYEETLKAMAESVVECFENKAGLFTNEELHARRDGMADVLEAVYGVEWGTARKDTAKAIRELKEARRNAR